MSDDYETTFSEGDIIALLVTLQPDDLELLQDRIRETLQGNRQGYIRDFPQYGLWRYRNGSCDLA